MRSVKRAALILLLLLLVPVLTGLGVTALAYTAGTIRVEVDTPEAHFSVPLPAGFVPMALRLVPRAVCREMPGEVEGQWAALRVAAEEIERIPDAVLIDVEGRSGEHVQIAKQGHGFVIRVRSGDERVQVSLPASAVSSVATELQRTCEG